VHLNRARWLAVPVTAAEDPLETDRLVLRRWREQDAPRLYDIQSRRDVVQWLSDDFDNPELIKDVDDARGRIGRYEKVFAEPPQGIWAIVPRDGDDVPAGAILLKTLPHAEHGEIEIGWWLHPDSHGNGYATEGATAVLDHAFTGGLGEVWAVMYPANMPSRAVMTRLGMTDLGVHERWYPGESQVMRITAEEWSRGRP
jgi:RimJ/RimL family protein N-acetyltransferase